MDQIAIHKRRFLGLVVSAACLFVVGTWRWTSRSPDLPCFYVAGVRFNAIQALLRSNERVRLQLSLWKGQRCYEVRTAVGERIGYVPRRYVAKITKIANRDWRICAVNRYAVPWKRYKISLVS
jgi:hypothetical protein